MKKEGGRPQEDAKPPAIERGKSSPARMLIANLPY